MKAFFLFAILAILAVAHGTQITTADVPDQFGMDDVVETLRGIFESWEVNKEEVTKLLECVRSLKDLEKQIGIIMEEIKQIDLKDLAKLVEMVVKLFGAFQQLFKDILPCIDAKGEIIKLVNKFIHLTPIEMLKKLAMNLLDNGRRLLNDILAGISAFQRKDFYQFGYQIGEVIELLFLRTPDP